MSTRIGIPERIVVGIGEAIPRLNTLCGFWDDAIRLDKPTQGRIGPAGVEIHEAEVTYEITTSLPTASTAHTCRGDPCGPPPLPSRPPSPWTGASSVPTSRRGIE